MPMYTRRVERRGRTNARAPPRDSRLVLRGDRGPRNARERRGPHDSARPRRSGCRGAVHVYRHNQVREASARPGGHNGGAPEARGRVEDRAHARVGAAFRRGHGAGVRSAPLTMRPLLALAIVAFTSFPAAAQQSNPRRDSLIARAKALELSTPYVPPPGTALEHHAAGFAQIMCSAVFITGLDPDFAAENVGYLTAAKSGSRP